MFLMCVNFDKLTIRLNFFSFTLHTYKLSKQLEINNFVTNQIFKFQNFLFYKIVNKDGFLYRILNSIRLAQIITCVL